MTRASVGGDGRATAARSLPFASRLLLALLWLLAAGATMATPLPLTGPNAGMPLAPHLRLLHDASGELGLDQALQRLAAGDFTADPRGQANHGFLPGALWFHFEVENRSDVQDWLLVVEYTLVDRLRLYRIDGGRREPVWEGGDRLPFAARSVPMRYFNTRIHLAPGERASFLLEARSESSMQVPLVWADEASYLAAQQPASFGLGLYFGVLLALAAYNFILFCSVRDRNFLHYVVYVLCVGLMLLCLSGIAFQQLWPGSPDWANTAVLVSISLALITMLQFSRRFLDLNPQFRLGNQLCLAMIGLAAALGVAGFFAPYSVVVRLQTLMVFPAAALIYACGLVCLRSFPPARYFLIAWTALLVGIMVYAAVSMGWLPKTAITEYAIQLGSGAEMVLLSFALANRINVLTAASARIEGEAREQLESRVRERTADLDAALQRLEDANRRLEDYSRRDGLTGTFNRRSFDHILRRAEQERLERAQPYAVLMIDIDHFKQVNDQYGHLVGDDCLRHVAQLLEAPVQEAGGQLARYGGEEFAAVLPGCDANAAAALAERLRARIAERPLISSGRHIPLTASFGVASRGATASGSALDCVGAADAALYRAKQAGRNRVVL